jgi:hypothetical protein
MQKITHAEALSLIAHPLVCEEINPWIPMKVQPGTAQTGGGLLKRDGTSAGMFVDLYYRSTHRTKITTYKFTLFKRFPNGNERVYQLEVTQTPKRVKDLHKLSHEHMGDARTMGDARWSTWDYDEVLAHFCSMTNIAFEPKPLHPEAFHLTGR